MTGAISQDWERCQFPFVLDEKSHGCSGRSGRKAVEKGVKVSLSRRSVEVRASRAVGLRWQAALFGSFGIDRLDELGSAAGRGSAGPGEDSGNHRRIFDSGDDLKALCSAFSAIQAHY